MSTYAFNLLVSALIILITVIGRYLVPFVKNELENTKFEAVFNWVPDAVRAAEQTMSEASGAERKLWVTTFLKNMLTAKNISISDDQLNTLIESAVYAMNAIKNKDKMEKSEEAK